MEYTKKFKFDKSLLQFDLSTLYISFQKALNKAREGVPYKTKNMQRSIHIEIVDNNVRVFIYKNYYLKTSPYFEYTNESKGWSSYGWWNKFLIRFETLFKQTEDKLTAKSLLSPKSNISKPREVLSKNLAESMNVNILNQVLRDSTGINIDIKTEVPKSKKELNIINKRLLDIRSNKLVAGLSVMYIIRLMREKLEENLKENKK